MEVALGSSKSMLIELLDECSDIRKEIFALMTPKTRAEICSVCKVFYEYSMYELRQAWPNQQTILRALSSQVGIISIMKNYHLVVRLKQPCTLDSSLAYAAGCSDVIELVQNHKPNRDYAIELRGACYGGHLKLVQSLLSLCNSRVSAYKGAGEGGQLHVIEYLNGIQAPTHGELRECFIGACYGGHYDLVKSLLDMKAIMVVHLKSGLGSACINGKLGIVKLMSEYGHKVNEETAKIIVRYGYTDILDYILEKNHMDATDTGILFKFICETNNVLALDIFIKHTDIAQPEWCWFGLIAACLQGHLGIVKRLVAIGDTQNTYGQGLLNACKTRQVEIIEYLAPLVDCHDDVLEGLDMIHHDDIIQKIINYGKISPAGYIRGASQACTNERVVILGYIINACEVTTDWITEVLVGINIDRKSACVDLLLTSLATLA